jgi:hypothetical protein
VLAARRTLALVLVLLGAVTPAYGARPNGVPPWAGGSSRVTPFEAAAATIAGALAGRPVSVQCVDLPAWRALAERHGFPVATWAMTPFRWDGETGRPVAEGRTVASPRACRQAAAFAAAPAERGARSCRHGTRTERRSDRQHGQEAVRVPVYGECDDWGLKLVAVHVLAHEAMHLAGVIDESEAECFAVQADAYVTRRLGATPTFARSIAREYWADYYPSQDRRYRSAECRDGGALDLFPARAGWPTPGRFPAGLAAAIAERATSGESRIGR